MIKQNLKGFKEALKLFKETAKNVPAYRAFLKRHAINPQKINSYGDFLKVPMMDKKNYLRFFDFFDLFPHRKIPYMISASSGSSGKPFYWPRGNEQEEIGGRIHENILKNCFGIKKNERTLVIVCFSMGTWIAGTFTVSSIKWIAGLGYNISVIPPSIEKEDAVNILRDLAPLFDRVIIAGYPPFLRDILEEAKIQKVNIKKLKLNLLFAGENFSEKYRQIMHQIAGIKNMFYGSASIYGTADAGAIGHETSASIFIRKIISKNKKFAKEFNLESFIPSIVQYDERWVFFEVVSGEMIFSTNSGIPLVRYNIRDTGQVISHDDMRVVLKSYGFLVEACKFGFEKWKMPFIFLGSRADVATTFYALNIYPENIKAGLESKDVYKLVSGKFIAKSSLFYNGRDQKLIIEVELARNVKPSKSIENKIRNNLFDNLIKLNMEYRKLYRSIGSKAIPSLILVSFGDNRFVVKKSKHIWSKKD